MAGRKGNLDVQYAAAHSLESGFGGTKKKNLEEVMQKGILIRFFKIPFL